MSGRIVRMVVPFDAASETRSALAARLPAHAEAQLHGVFIDEDLLHLVDLPSARQAPGTATA
jgi:hypothetical protein